MATKYLVGPQNALASKGVPCVVANREAQNLQFLKSSRSASKQNIIDVFVWSRGLVVAPLHLVFKLRRLVGQRHERTAHHHHRTNERRSILQYLFHNSNSSSSIVELLTGEVEELQNRFWVGYGRSQHEVAAVSAALGLCQGAAGHLIFDLSLDFTQRTPAAALATASTATTLIRRPSIR